VLGVSIPRGYLSHRGYLSRRAVHPPIFRARARTNLSKLRSRLETRSGSDRTAFYVIIALALSIIVCGVLTQSFGWNRVCGSAVLVIGAVLFLLADDKKWPAVILIAGLAVFFGDSLLGLLSAAPK